MKTWLVTYTTEVTRTVRITAKDEDSAEEKVKNGNGEVIDESELSFELDEIEEEE